WTPATRAGRNKDVPRREAGLGGTAYDLLALGQEEPVLGLEVRPELYVAQVAVVGEPLGLRIGDLDQLCHGLETLAALAPRSPKTSGCATATTSPTTMIAGGRTACRSRSAPRSARVESAVRPPRIDPSQTTATGVVEGRPALSRAAAMWGAFSTAIISSRVPRSRPSAS